MNETEVKLSRYNSAMPQIFRIDNLWQKTHEFAVAVSYSKWNEYLDRIWMEFEDDAHEDVKTSMESINKKLDNLSIYGLSRKLKKEKPLLYSKLIKLQKKHLMDKEIILRTLQNTSGKGTAYQESIKNYMD